jgi:hypothetical protein
MNNDRRRSIFVLAGMPASGISELLEERDRLNLFGRFSEELAGRNRKPYYFFKNLKARAEKDPNFSWPDQVVLHLEITAACSFKLNSYHLFRDENFVFNEFANNLSGLFSHYTNKVINTIEPDLPSLVQRYFARPHESSNVARLYRDGDEETLRCMFNAWNRYLAQVNCYQLRTECDNPSQQQQTHANPPNWTKAIFSPQWRIRI